PILLMSWHGPDTRNDSVNSIVADVFSGILAQNASKWQQALIDKGLATQATVLYSTNKYVGPIEINVLPNPTKLKECVEEVNRQIAMMGNEDYFTDEQLETAKQTIRRNNVRQSEKPSWIPHLVTYWWCSGSLDYYFNYVNACGDVNKTQLADYANKYLVNKPHVAGLVINKEMNESIKPSTFFKY
ncbi:MAG: insulinase family protein, partial [Chitinophagaceae bacterium]